MHNSPSERNESKKLIIIVGISFAIVLVIASLAPFALHSQLSFLFPKDTSQAQVPSNTNNVSDFFLGDIDGNGLVDVYDLGIFAFYYGSSLLASSLMEQELSDLNTDGNIDVFDLGIFSGLYGTDYLTEFGDIQSSPTPTISTDLIDSIDQLLVD